MLRVHVLITFALLAGATTLVQAGARDKRDIMFPGYNEPPNFYQPNHHHHHHHRPPTPLPSRRPGYHGTTPSPDRASHLPRAIPDDLFNLLNEVKTVEDYMKFVKRNYSSGDSSLVGNRIGEDNIEKKSVKTPILAHCTPEEQTVSLQVENRNPRYMYMPMCVRVKRCGGCCPNSIHGCIPTNTSTDVYKVIGLEYNGDGRTFNEKESQLVSVDVHHKCKCGCKISHSSCNTFQTFDKRTCTCNCSNKDDQRKCMNNDMKQWDPMRCMCICRIMKECSTGSQFNQNTCSCEAQRVTAKRILENRRRREEDNTTIPSKSVQPLKQEN